MLQYFVVFKHHIAAAALVSQGNTNLVNLTAIIGLIGLCLPKFILFVLLMGQEKCAFAVGMLYQAFLGGEQLSSLVDLRGAGGLGAVW